MQATSSNNRLKNDIVLPRDCDEFVPVIVGARLVAFARDMTAHGPIRPGLIVVSGAAARDGSKPLLICEVVGRLILTALQGGFKLRMFT